MIREGKQLDLVFTVPSELRRAYRRKSTEYVEELIGHEGEGSLFASLKSRGLAERICAGVAAGGLADTTCRALFTVTVKLTDEGFGKVDDVISLFFQYVEMMRRTGPQEWCWREAKDLRGIEFRFKEEEGAAEYTEMLAMTMRRFEHADVLRGEYAFDEFHRGDIESVVDCITPRKCVYIVSDHAFDCDAPGVGAEKWFDAPFSRSAVEEKKLAEWESNEPDAALRYPPRNVYIAERFELKAGSETRLEAAKKAGVVPPDATTPPPAPLVDAARDRARVRADAPVAPGRRQVRPAAHERVLPREFAGHRGLARCVRGCGHAHSDDPRPAAGPRAVPRRAGVARAGLDVVGQHTGLSLTFDGFDCKLPRLVRAYFGAVAAFELDPARFRKVKEKRLKDLKNYGLKPGRQARSLLHQLLKRREASEASKIAALEAMEPEALTRFARAAWTGAAHVEGLVIGNVTAEEALAMGASIRESFASSAPVAADAFPRAKSPSCRRATRASRLRRRTPRRARTWCTCTTSTTSARTRAAR